MKFATLRWSIGVLLLLGAIALIGAWQLQAREALKQWKPDLARNRDRPIPVRTAEVSQEMVSELIGGTAVTVPSQTATVVVSASSGPLTSRLVTGVHCWQGMAVKKGQVLIEFDCDLFQQVVKQRAAALARAQAEVANYQTLRRASAASALELTSAEVALETARVDHSLAVDDLEQCTVVSPIDGVVDEVHVAPGMRVNGALTLATVHALAPLHVQMDYPVERLDSLQIGQDVQIVLDSFPQEKFHGSVIRVGPVASQRTRVLPVIIELENPDARLKAGITGFVRVTTSPTLATTVPQVALIKGAHKAMVFCVNDQGRAQIREVKTGNMATEGRVAVLAGLAPGEQVVVHGQDSLKNNDPVDPEWRRWTRRDP